MWSSDGENWVIPPYYAMHRGGSMHGSAGGPWHRNGWNNGHEEWERLNGFFDSADERVWLPFWGSSDRAGHIQYGGCCHEEVGDTPRWGRAFIMSVYYCEAGGATQVEAEEDVTPNLNMKMPVLGATETNKRGLCDSVASSLNGQCQSVSLRGPRSDPAMEIFTETEVNMQISVENIDDARAVLEDDTFTDTVQTQMQWPADDLPADVTVGQPYSVTYDDWWVETCGVMCEPQTQVAVDQNLDTTK